MPTGIAPPRAAPSRPHHERPANDSLKRKGCSSFPARITIPGVWWTEPLRGARLRLCAGRHYGRTGLRSLGISQDFKCVLG